MIVAQCLYLTSPKLLKVPPGTELIRESEGSIEAPMHCQKCSVPPPGTAQKEAEKERKSK